LDLRKSKLVNYLLRGIVIFIISVGAIILFWFHAELYKFGLLVLLIFGGIGLAALISALGWLTRPQGCIKKRSKNKIYFDAEEIPKVLFGAVSMMAVPVNKEKPPSCGSTCVARVAGSRKSPFANLMIEDLRRKIVEDLNNEDLEKMGFRNIESFIQSWEQSGTRLSLDDELYLAEFEVLDKGRF
jgi:hypothetical protein